MLAAVATMCLWQKKTKLIQTDVPFPFTVPNGAHEAISLARVVPNVRVCDASMAVGSSRQKIPWGRHAFQGVTDIGTESSRTFTFVFFVPFLPIVQA